MGRLHRAPCCRHSKSPRLLLQATESAGKLDMPLPWRFCLAASLYLAKLCADHVQDALRAVRRRRMGPRAGAGSPRNNEGICASYGTVSLGRFTGLCAEACCDRMEFAAANFVTRSKSVDGISRVHDTLSEEWMPKIYRQVI